MCFREIENIRHGFEDIINNVFENENIPLDLKKAVETAAFEIDKYVFKKFLKDVSNLLNVADKNEFSEDLEQGICKEEGEGEEYENENEKKRKQIIVQKILDIIDDTDSNSECVVFKN